MGASSTRPNARATLDIVAVGVVAELPVARIRRFAGQPRTRFDRAALDELRDSVAAIGQQVPVIVRRVDGDPRHDYELIDGERRWRVAGELGLATIRAWVRDDVGDGADQYVAAVVANFGRSPHTAIEIGDILAALEASAAVQALPTQEARLARLAAIFGRSVPWVYSHRSLTRLVPEARALADEVKINPGVWRTFASVAPARQVELAKKIRRYKPARKTVERWIRAARRQAPTPGVKGRQPETEPARQWALVRNGLRMIVSRTEALINVSARTLRHGLQAIAPGERVVLVRELERAQGELDEITQAVRRMVTELGKE